MLATTWRLMNPVAASRHLWRVRGLVYSLSRREVEARYRGSALGVVWAFVNSIALLLIYTFVFGVIFRSRWPEHGPQGLGGYAITLFCGLVPYMVFSETLTRSPTLVTLVPAYVKRIVFPLEILPLGLLGSVLFHGLVNVIVLVAALLVTTGGVPWTIALLPLVATPLLFLCLGLAWLTASLGVFIRDLAQGIGLVAHVMLFVTPIFYPLDAIPPAARPWMALNPLASIVDGFRRVVLWGETPEWAGLGIWVVLTGILMMAGYAWFMKTKRAFADVM
jgi:lipopolysaccharide transport system permease protein